MSGSCCGGSTKSELAKIVMMTVQQPTDAAAEKPAAEPNRSECCNDKAAKSQKHGCGC